MSSAFAEEYSVDIHINSEDDIYELYQNGLITSDEQDRLITLYQDKVDINKDSRDELYQLPGISYPQVDAIIKARNKQPFTSIAQLKKVNGMDNSTYKQIKPFIKIIKAKIQKGNFFKNFSGKLRLKGISNVVDTTKSDTSVFKSKNKQELMKPAKDAKNPDNTTEDNTHAPAFYLKADVNYANKYQVGAIGLFQNGLAAPDYYGTGGSGSDSGYFVSQGTKYLVTPVKYYAEAHFNKLSIIAGHYRIGFGLGLALDTTTKTNPYGFYRDNVLSEQMDGAKYSFYKGFRGAALSYKGLELNKNISLDAVVFASYSSYDSYQYDFSPHEIHVSGNEDKHLSYQTIPDVFSETTFGGNIRMDLFTNAYVGITAYYSMLKWNYDGSFTLADSSKFPEDRTKFGAGSFNFGIGLSDFSLFGEFAAMDNKSGAAFVKGIFEKGLIKNEFSFRYYGTDFGNPHGRGSSEADEYNGNSSRDEYGFKNKFAITPFNFLKFHFYVDVWNRPSFDKWNLYAYFRADYIHKFFSIFTTCSLNDRDLSISITDRNQTYSSTDDYPGGMKLYGTVQLNIKPFDFAGMSFFYKRSFEDVASMEDSFEPTQYLWARLWGRFNKSIIGSLRYKYYDENTTTDFKGDKYHEIYGELQWKLAKLLFFKLRATAQFHKTKSETTYSAGNSTYPNGYKYNETKQTIIQIKATFDYFF